MTPAKRRIVRAGVFRFMDPDGTPMVAVGLRNTTRRAFLPAAVHDSLVALLGPRVAWTVDDRRAHVVARGKGKEITVARLILDAAPRSRLHYQDEDPLNLRVANVRPGRPPRAPEEPPHQHDVDYRHHRDDGFAVLGERGGCQETGRAGADGLPGACGDPRLPAVVCPGGRWGPRGSLRAPVRASS